MTAAPPLPSRRQQAGEPQRAIAIAHPSGQSPGGQPLGHPAAPRAAGPRAPPRRRRGALSPPHSCPLAADGAATRQLGVAARVIAGAACQRGAERQRGGDASALAARRRRQAGGWARWQAWVQTAGGRRPGGQVDPRPGGWRRRLGRRRQLRVVGAAAPTAERSGGRCAGAAGPAGRRRPAAARLRLELEKVAAHVLIEWCLEAGQDIGRE